jgi:hypothetical protein
MGESAGGCGLRLAAALLQGLEVQGRSYGLNTLSCTSLYQFKEFTVCNVLALASHLFDVDQSNGRMSCKACSPPGFQLISALYI